MLHGSPRSASSKLLFGALLMTACVTDEPAETGTESGSGGTTEARTSDDSTPTDDSNGGSTSTDSTTAEGSTGGSSAGSTGGSGSTGVDDSTGGPGSTGPEGTTTSGSDSSGSSSTGSMACPEPPTGPAGLPGVNASTIWISNSTQSTLSKVDTETLAELGRFYTRADAIGSPSRTSVNLEGDVVVANRSGGLTKFYGNVEDCVDANGNLMIDTSSGAGDILPWGDDECLAWHAPMVYTSQRPVAWTAGQWDPEACAYVEQKVWSSGATGDAIEVLFVDGDTGVVEETIPIPGVPANFYGIYGAAVDAQGNFWGSQLGQGTLVRVEAETFEVSTWPMAASGYGMTVDQEGYVWTCASVVGRFDPVAETWMTASVGGSGGCMAAGDQVWLAANPMIGINRQTLGVDYSIPLPEYVHGLSVDFAGYVWGVSMGANAYRVDPDTGTFDTFTGLVNAYTYSDMTGYALASVSAP